MAEHADGIFEFAGFRLDARQHRLQALSDGRTVPLTPRVFDTLLLFVTRPGELLDKATLMSAIWPNVVVEENSLNQNISALRRALGEKPDEHRFIVTVPGRGYRFVADVKHGAREQNGGGAESSPERPSPERLLREPARARETLASIAVLPFANLTGDPAKEYIGDGMAEELIHSLARVSGLKVPARTSSFAYKGRNTDIRDVGRELAVDAVLEGSVRAAGERIRITAQLIDATSGYHLWSHSFDRHAGDLFELQDELASTVLRTLKLSVNSLLPDRVAPDQPTADLEAYQLCLQAVSLFWVPTESHISQAMELLRQATSRDPKFARAWASLGMGYIHAVQFDFPIADAISQAQSNAQRALSLDPDSGVALGVLGTVHAVRGEWIAAAQRLSAARAVEPYNPGTLFNECIHIAQTTGHLSSCLQLMSQACALAPREGSYSFLVAITQVIMDRDAEAVKNLRLAESLGFPRTTPPMPDTLAQLAFREGRFDEAAGILIPSLSPQILSLGGAEAVQRVCKALSGRAARQEAVASLDQLERALPADASGGILRKRFLVWYAMLGDLDAAYASMHGTLDHYNARRGSFGAAWGCLWLHELREFRRDPRFQELATRMKLFDYWNEYGPPDGCEIRQGKLIVP